MRQEEIKQFFISACSPRNLPNYDEEDEPISCLSTDPHDETVEDAVQHYFGCLEISKRAEFLKPEHPHWRHERDVQLEKYQLELSQMKEKCLTGTDKPNIDKTNADKPNTNETSADKIIANNSSPDSFSDDNSSPDRANVDKANADKANADRTKWESYLCGIQDKIREAGHVVPVDVVATFGILSDTDADKLLEKLVDERANVWLEKRMGSVAIAIEAQYKRIRVLRNALSKTRVTPPTAGSQDTASERKNSNQSLKLALVYLHQWVDWDNSRKQELKTQTLTQGQKARKNWKVNQNHERLLIKHVFEIEKVSEADMVAFYQYVPSLKGVVRSRLWELAQDTKEQDIEAGAAEFLGKTQEQTKAEEKQREYEHEVSRFFMAQKQQQPDRSPEERSFDNLAVFQDVEKRLKKRVRVEHVLEILTSSEQTVVKTVVDSGNAWRESKHFKKGIACVQKWKEERETNPLNLAGKDNNNNNNVDLARSSINRHNGQLCIPARQGRDSENDQRSKISAITYHDDEPGRKEVRALAKKQRTKKNDPASRQDAIRSHDEGTTANIDEDYGEYELEKDVNAYLIQFKVKYEGDKTSQHPETFLEQHEEPLTDDRFKGTFPDQRISMSLLLDSGLSEGSTTDNVPNGENSDAEQVVRNILSRQEGKCRDGSQKIRYFHIPIKQHGGM